MAVDGRRHRRKTERWNKRKPAKKKDENSEQHGRVSGGASNLLVGDLGHLTARFAAIRLEANKDMSKRYSVVQ